MKQKYFDKINQPYYLYFCFLTVPLALLMFYLLFTHQYSIVTLFSYIISYIIVYIYGTNIYFHRFWSHRQFKSNILLTKFFTTAGLFSLSGGPVHYTLVHRYHHYHSDTELDPHSPLKGRWFAFIGWLFQKNPSPIPLKIVKDFFHEENNWVLKIDAYKIYIVHSVVILTLLINPKITLGLLFAMFNALLIELSINAFLHNVKSKTAVNAHPIICWLTAGGTMHELHHNKSAVISKDDPGYFFVKLVTRV
jgi:fatty-acid desaturase